MKDLIDTAPEFVKAWLKEAMEERTMWMWKAIEQSDPEMFMDLLTERIKEGNYHPWQAIGAIPEDDRIQAILHYMDEFEESKEGSKWLEEHTISQVDDLETLIQEYGVEWVLDQIDTYRKNTEVGYPK